MLAQYQQPETSGPCEVLGQAVTMDKQGRVLIPIVLRGSAQMKGAVDVIHYLNYLEVWNHARFLKNLKGNPMTAQDERMLNKLSSASRFPWAVHRNEDENYLYGTERRSRVRHQVRPNTRGQNHPIRDARTDSAEGARVA